MSLRGRRTGEFSRRQERHNFFLVRLWQRPASQRERYGQFFWRFISITRFASKTRSGRKNGPASLSKPGFINPRRTCFARPERETPILRAKILALTILSRRSDSLFDQRSHCQPCNRSNPETMVSFGFFYESLQFQGNFPELSCLCAAKCSNTQLKLREESGLMLWSIGRNNSSRKRRQSK